MSKQTPQEVLRKLLPLSSEKKYADAFAAAIDALDERERLRAGHCKDCCCARSWEALGISGYTGHDIPDHIRQLKQRVAELEAKCTKVHITSSDEAPAPGLYVWPTATQHGVGEVFINIPLHANVDPSSESAISDFRKMIEETLLHELIHVCEDVVLGMTSEVTAEKLAVMANNQEYMDEGQAVSELSESLREANKRIAELEAETERLRKWDLKQRELYDIQAQQNADHYKQRIAELEPFQPVKWALVSGNPSYDDLADEHAKAVQLVGELSGSLREARQELEDEKSLRIQNFQKALSLQERVRTLEAFITQWAAIYPHIGLPNENGETEEVKLTYTPLDNSTQETES